MMTSFSDLLHDFEERQKEFFAVDILGPVQLCGRCHETWPLDEEFFYRSQETATGFETRCKACRVETSGTKRTQKKTQLAA